MKVLHLKLCRFGWALSLILTLSVLQGCGNSPLAPANGARIQGRVLNAATTRPISGVQVSSYSFPQSGYSDDDGRYSFDVTLADSTIRQVSLIYTHVDYQDMTQNVSVQLGQVTAVPDAQLSRKAGSAGSASGPASNVVQVDVQTTSVFVKGSGANETSTLTFEVRDSNGIPVDNDHQTNVRFVVISGPGGGEFVSPDTVLTDANGLAMTTLNSGTISGTVQIRAEVVGTTIRSQPVPVAISGWLPDLGHFSIASAQNNFAAYNRVNLRNALTALVGDKFSNPVPAGTAVWFSTTGGVVQRSVVTDADGLASVDLISGKPLPDGIDVGVKRVLNINDYPAYFQGPGYAVVTAQTTDENNQPIYAEKVVLFSGITTLQNVSPRTFDLAPDASVTFIFTAADQFGNPLAPGTTISVTAGNGKVTGANQLTLGDNLRRNYIQGDVEVQTTSFTAKLTNSDAANIQGEPTTVTISVAGPNGSARLSIEGFLRKPLAGQ